MNLTYCPNFWGTIRHLESKDVDLSSWNEEEEVARYETELSE